MKMLATSLQPNWMSTILRQTMGSLGYAGKTSSEAQVAIKLKTIAMMN